VTSGRQFSLLAAEVCGSAGSIYTVPERLLLRGLARLAGYPLQSPIAPSLPLPCAAVCHVILIAL
jgi:hypothetical protein